jgi:hypothetical protein
MPWKPSESAALNAVFVLRRGMALGAGPEGADELLRDWKPEQPSGPNVDDQGANGGWPFRGIGLFVQNPPGLA